MDSREVDKAIREVIRPILKAHGFSKFAGRNAWRFDASKLDVLNFQSFDSYTASVIDCTTASFSVNLGVRLFDVNKEKLPKEYECELRGRLRRTFHQPQLERRDIWYIDKAGVVLPTAMSDVAKAFHEQALPWFARLADKQEVLRLLREDEETEELWGFGAKGSPYRVMLLDSVRRWAAK